MGPDENIISALDFAEKCIKIVSCNLDLYKISKKFYRKEKIFINRFIKFKEKSPEYIIALAYENFKFVLLNKQMSFFKKEDEGILCFDNTVSIDMIQELYENKGIINEFDVYVSSKACDLLTLINETPIYNPLVNDSYMMKCYKRVVEHILQSLNVNQVPRLKESNLNAFIDEVFRPSEYSKTGFSQNKREALAFMFDKSKTA